LHARVQLNAARKRFSSPPPPSCPTAHQPTGQPTHATHPTPPLPPCSYLAAAYALKHPDHVQHLVLVCPAGVVRKRGKGFSNPFQTLFEPVGPGGSGPTPPPAAPHPCATPPPATVQAARPCRPRSPARAPCPTAAPARARPPPTPSFETTQQPEKPEGWESRYSSPAVPALRRALFRAAAGAWEAGVTPGAVIRALGPWGPWLVDRYVGGRFSYHGKPLTQEEVPVFRWGRAPALVTCCLACACACVLVFACLPCVCALCAALGLCVLCAQDQPRF
jgi:hypothetical protein